MDDEQLPEPEPSPFAIWLWPWWAWALIVLASLISWGALLAA